MRKIVSLAATAAALAVVAPANAATVIPLTSGPGGSLTGGVSMHPAAGAFTETFTFTLPSVGTTGAVVQNVFVNAATNVTNWSGTLNGSPLTFVSGGGFHIGSINLGTAAGVQTLVLSGVAGANASYSVNVSFAPGAGPEPATWGMLILGFGAIGAGLRRRSAKVSYA